MTNFFKNFMNKVFRRRKLDAEGLYSSPDVSNPSHASPVSLNDNISKSTIPLAVSNQSQDTLLNPRTAESLRSSAPSRVDTANKVSIEKADRPRSEECSTSLRPSQQPVLVKAGSVAWKGLETALRLLERSADAFPPLKSAIGGLVACLDVAQAVVENRKEYENLANELKSIAETLAQYVSKLVESDAGDQIAHIVKSIADEVKSVGYKQDRRMGIRIVEANEDSGDILQHYRRIESLFRQLQTHITLKTAEDARNSHEKALLDEMSPVQSARYNSSYSTNIGRRGCTAETREKIIQDLKDWAGSKGGAKVYWMNGMAGTGKTTIGYSLCEWLAKVGKLGGNFFCSRAEPSCRDANNIIPTLAFQLSQSSPAYRSALCKVLKEEPQACKLEVRWQFQKLIESPIRAVKEAVLEDTVIVIDALDECDDGKAFRLFLETLLKLAPDLPFKIFLTSRPEPVIRKKMLEPGRSRSVLHLHDIEESVVEADIKKYLTDAFHTMSPRPSSYQVEQLAKRAGRLFIYAATAVRYIHPDSHVVDSAARLKRVLGLTTGSGKQHEELDKLYTSVLSAAFDNDLEVDEIDNIRLTLWTVVCAREPVSLKTIASLRSLKKDALHTSLEPLRSVLFVQEGVDGLVAPFHASFPDYILQRDRSKQFHCNEAQHHELLANGCFDVMKAQLRFNICNLESSFAFDEDVPDLECRVRKNISPTLSYACRFWAEHLQKGNSSEAVHKNLDNFLRKQLLYWMEVLNLEKRIFMGADILRQGQNRLKDCPGNTMKQIANAASFVARFAGGACRRSTPHIYISAVPFCAKSSLVYDNYGGCMRGLMEVEGRAIKEWHSAAIVVGKTDGGVCSVAFSPDGTRIVSDSGNRTIRVWDARSGDVAVGPFEGHTSWVRSVAFSSDGSRIVSGSNDRTIRVWDARSGDTVAGPFEGHIDGVTSVAFSPDGTRIVSGSDDQTIRVWEARSGDVVAGPFEGHTDSVTSVAFSPDGTCIVSGSDDQTIQVWDAHSGDVVAGPFEGHTDRVKSVAFSPDGTRIVSGSNDCTLRVWDAHSGNVVAGPFEDHTHHVTSVAFSPDGTHIVSGSKDRTIRVWDARSGDVVAGPFEGHTDYVTSVAFSPDGTHIVSGSGDQTIRVWDVCSGDVVADPFKGHTRDVTSVAFSPDGTRIVSGADDQTIRVWDAGNGDVVAGPFEGHTKYIRSVAFSPDGTHIVSGSADCTIRVWDARSGDVVAGPFEGHTSGVTSVAFSPDGTRVVSGLSDHAIRVWDARSGDVVAGTVEGHTDYVRPVAFSPDGTHIVSGSGDRTIRVWDARSGDVVAGPFEGHTDGVTSVAFSPDGTRIVSGSDDQTIRVWDARSGDVVAGPFEGHTRHVTSVAFSPDGTRIVSGSTDLTIRVWDARSGDVVAGPFEGHTGFVWSVAFSPDGTRIVSGSTDLTIRVWDWDRLTHAEHDSSIFCHTPHPLSQLKHFVFKQDGWITVDDYPFFWISPLFRPYLPFPSNTFVIGPRGSTSIAYPPHLNIGTMWTSSFAPHT